MAIELGKAYVQVIPSAKGISGAISNEIMPEAEEAGNKSGEKIGKNLVGRLKQVVIAAGLGKIIAGAIREGADLEQSLGGIETLYKGSADTMKKYANEAYKSVGVSANQYMEQVTSFSAGLIKSMGGDTAAAGEVANMAMIDMADNANKMGTSMQDIQNAYQGFAKQNYTMLDNLKLGYGGTKSEMERLLKDATALTGVKYDINNLSDVYSAVHAVQEELGITGTTAKEANETFSGSFNAMKAAYQNLAGAITAGGDVKSATQGLAETVVTFAKNALPMLENIAKEAPMAIVNVLTSAGPQLIEAGMNSLVEIINGFAAALPTMMPQIAQVTTDIIQILVNDIPSLIAAGTQVLTGFVQGLIAAIPVIVEALPQIIQAIIENLLASISLIIQAGMQLFTALVQALPEIITAIVAAIPQIIDSVITAIIASIPLIIQAGVDLLIALVQNLPLIITTIVNALPQIINGIVNGLLSNIGKIIQAGVDLLIALIENLPLVISEIVKAMPQIIEGIVSALGNGISQVIDVGVNLVRGLWDGIQSAAAWLWDKITGWITGIWDGIKGFFGIKSPSRKMAWIGEMITEGLADGITDHIKPVNKAMGLLEDAASGDFMSSFDATASFGWNGIGAGTLSESASGRSIVVNNYNQSPDPLTEREIARQTKISLQRLALGV